MLDATIDRYYLNISIYNLTTRLNLLANAFITVETTCIPQ